MGKKVPLILTVSNPNSWLNSIFCTPALTADVNFLEYYKWAIGFPGL